MSKGMGAMKAAKAAIEGLVGVFRVLSKQHGEASALLKRLDASPERHAELWPKIRAELLSHEKAELQELYPVLRNYDATRALAEHHDREAAELSALIARLDGLTPTSPDYQQTLTQLIDAIQHHVKEEEGDIFPKAQSTIGEDAARNLEAPLLAAKQRIMNVV